jgi:(2Fe-2S) ferredoxin
VSATAVTHAGLFTSSRSSLAGPPESNRRPHPQVKIPARGGNCPVLTKVDADLTPPPTYSTRCGKSKAPAADQHQGGGHRQHGGRLAGPALLVVPDNVWYGGVTEGDVPELVERHLIGGEAVEMLRIGPEDFCA